MPTRKLHYSTQYGNKPFPRNSELHDAFCTRYERSLSAFPEDNSKDCWDCYCSDKECPFFYQYSDEIGWYQSCFDNEDIPAHFDMRAYLAGLLALPSETERILKEMESEKRGER